MMERIDQVKERIETINNGIKNLRNFSSIKQGELFGKIVSQQLKTASAPDFVDDKKATKQFSKETTKELSDEVNKFIETTATKYGASGEIIKNEIENLLGTSDSKKVNNNLNDLLTMLYLNSNLQSLGLPNSGGLNNIYSMNLIK